MHSGWCWFLRILLSTGIGLTCTTCLRRISDDRVSMPCYSLPGSMLWCTTGGTRVEALRMALVPGTEITHAWISQTNHEH